MSKHLRISWDEVVKLLELECGGQVTFMCEHSYEKDGEAYDLPDYILVDITQTAQSTIKEAQ